MRIPGLQAQVPGLTADASGRLTSGAMEAPDFAPILQMVMKVREHEQQQQLAREKIQRDAEYDRQKREREDAQLKVQYQREDEKHKQDQQMKLDAAFPDAVRNAHQLQQGGLHDAAARVLAPYNYTLPVPGTMGVPGVPGPVPRMPAKDATPRSHWQGVVDDALAPDSLRSAAAANVRAIDAAAEKAKDRVMRQRQMNLDSADRMHKRAVEQATADAEAEATARAPIEAKREARANFIQKRLEASDPGSVTPQFMAALNAEADLAYGPGGGGPEDVISAMQESSRKMLEGLKNRKR